MRYITLLFVVITTLGLGACASAPTVHIDPTSAYFNARCQRLGYDHYAQAGSSYADSRHPEYSVTCEKNLPEYAGALGRHFAIAFDFVTRHNETACRDLGGAIEGQVLVHSVLFSRCERELPLQTRDIAMIRNAAARY